MRRIWYLQGLSPGCLVVDGGEKDEEEEEEKKEGGGTALIKSNKPHLAGGE